MLTYRVLRKRLRLIGPLFTLILQAQMPLHAALKEGCETVTLKLELITFDPGTTSSASLQKPLEVALKRLLVEDEELESPINNAREVAAMRRRKAVSKEQNHADAVAVLAEHFNKKSSQLTLVGAGKGHKPERGEDVEKNWVFSLVMPTLSDHIYWVVVPKDAPDGAYVYGFN